ncbi:unnamed protein product [Discosporangium mesarthrocarpum]
MSGLSRMYGRFFPPASTIIKGVTTPDKMLYSFGTRDSTDGWDTATDQSSGGKSECSVEWHPWGDKWKSDGVEGMGERLWQSNETGELMGPCRGHMHSQWGLSEREAEVAPSLPDAGFMRFRGNLSLHKSPTAKVSGFCGARPPRRVNALDLELFQGMEMRMRGDGRKYEVNVEVLTTIPDDMYQGYLHLPPGEWVTVSLPFERLLLTGRGQIRLYQRSLDWAKLHSIGFSVADGEEGPFQLDVAWVAAVQEVLKEPPRKMPPRPQGDTLEW